MFQAVTLDQMRGGNADAPPSTTEPSSALPSGPVPSDGVLSTSSIVSSGGSSQALQSDQQPSMSDTSTIVLQTSVTKSISDLPPAHISSSSEMTASSNVSLQPHPSLVPPNLFYARPPVFSRPPGIPAPPGLVASPSAAHGVFSSSSVPHRPGMPAVQPPGNSTAQMYPPYHSLPTMAGAPQGMWMQPPVMSVMPRAPILSHHAPFPGSYPFSARGMSPAASFADSQPPGVPPVASTGPTPLSSGIVSTASWAEPVTGIDKKTRDQELGDKDDSEQGERLDAWTAHKTETGVVYYYNALTGQSTYEKPPGFSGEPDKVPVQPTPVSMEHLPGTDWALVTTNDGKKYYYNSKTKISSWQIPAEVTNSRKKLDAERLTGQSPCVPNADLKVENRSTPILTAPALTNGGREAASFKTTGVTGSSSALDLIKKKLQDTGVPSTSPPSSISSALGTSEANGDKAAEVSHKGVQSLNGNDKAKDTTGNGDFSDCSSDSDDEDGGPTKEECIIQFKEMLKERGVAPFSKWEKELPKIVFDPRFKKIASHSLRRSLFEHYVKTRAEEERREKRAAQRAAIEGFKQLLDEASKDIDHYTDYQTFKRKWGNDPRFEALERKEREAILNERVLSLKRAAEQKVQELRAAAASSFKLMLQERRDITINSRWSRMRDSFRNDPRYKSVAHEEREVLFNEYINELRAVREEVDQETKAKLGEQEKLKERERELRKRKEREEQEMERVRVKVRRKEAVSSFQALLVETIKDPQASWTESKPKLEKDPQGRASNSELDSADMEKLFREHVKTLHERCTSEFRSLLIEVITPEAASQEAEDGKTVLNSWSTAKRLLKSDPRYNKMPRKDREALWRRYADDLLRKQKLASDPKEEKNPSSKSRSSAESRRTHDRR